MDGDIIFSYTLEQAFEDGILIPISVDRVRLIPPQPPVVVTRSVAENIDQPTLQCIWDAYCAWFGAAYLLPEEDQLFAIEVDGQTVWVIEDDSAITILRPEDY